MKRFFICVVALVLLFTLHTPVLAENKQFYCRRNDSLVVPITVVENPNTLVSATVRVMYDHNVFQLNRADAQDDQIALPMIISGIPARYPLDLPFQVKSDAPVGTYEITAELVPGSGLDLNMNVAGDLRLSSMTVVVVDRAVIIDVQKENLFGSGTLPNNADANSYDTPGRYAVDATCAYSNLPITAGTLEVIRPDENVTACTQIASSVDNSYTRTRVGSDWGAWISAYDLLNTAVTTSSNTAAAVNDLSSRLGSVSDTAAAANAAVNDLSSRLGSVSDAAAAANAAVNDLSGRLGSVSDAAAAANASAAAANESIAGLSQKIGNNNYLYEFVNVSVSPSTDYVYVGGHPGYALVAAAVTDAKWSQWMSNVRGVLSNESSETAAVLFAKPAPKKGIDVRLMLLWVKRN